MPVVKWGIDSGDVDDWDRDSQYKPYAGPVPPNGVYAWRLKKLQSISGTRDKKPQLRAGLELIPRADFDEEKYRGYYITAFLPVAANTGFRYVPLLDALGVSGSEFVGRTKTDVDGNIISIGKWRNKGDTIVIAQLGTEKDQNNDDKKTIKTFSDLPDDVTVIEDPDVEPPDDDDFTDDAIQEDYEEEDESPRSRRGASRSRTRATGRSTSKRTSGIHRTSKTRRGSTSRGTRTRDDAFDEEDGF